MAAVRARCSLEEMDGWLPPPVAFLWYPAAVLGVGCVFDLKLVAPTLPPFDVPAGHKEASWLRELTWRGAATRYVYTKHGRRRAALVANVITYRAR